MGSKVEDSVQRNGQYMKWSQADSSGTACPRGGQGVSCWQGAMFKEGEVHGVWKWGGNRISVNIILELINYLTTYGTRVDFRIEDIFITNTLI